MASKSPVQHAKFIRTDYDVFDLLYKQGNEVLDASIVRSYISTQNTPMLVETVCYVLDLCERYNQTTQTIANVRDPTLIGQRFTLQGVIDALAINQGRVDTSTEYTLPLITAIFTYNPDLLNFLSILRAKKNWTSNTFRQSLQNSIYNQYINSIQNDMPYIPHAFFTQAKVSKAVELAFIKYAVKPLDKAEILEYTAKLNKDLAPDVKPIVLPTSHTISGLLQGVESHHANFVTKYLSTIPLLKSNPNKLFPSFLTNPSLASQPKTLLYNDETLPLPIHISTSANEFSSFLVFSPLAGYGMETKEFMEQIPSALLRYLAMSIQCSNFEAFKLLLTIDMFMNLDDEDAIDEIKSSKKRQEEKDVYDAAEMNNKVNLSNKPHHDLNTYTPQPAMIGNIITESVITAILQKYSCFEKINTLAAEIEELQKFTQTGRPSRPLPSLQPVPEPAVEPEGEVAENTKTVETADGGENTPQPATTEPTTTAPATPKKKTDIAPKPTTHVPISFASYHALTAQEVKDEIALLQHKIMSYYHLAQLALRFHEGIFALYRYDFATPSQLVVLYIAAHCYEDGLILDRLKNHYDLSFENLFDYDNSSHLAHLQTDAVRTAYKLAIGDESFKKSRKTQIYDIFYTFARYQLPRCIEFYVTKVKRKKSIIDLTLPLNPLCVALKEYDIQDTFIHFLITSGAPFLPHSKYGEQYNVVLAVLQSLDHTQQRSLELFNFIQTYTTLNTKESINITMDEFFAFLSRITRLPLRLPGTVQSQQQYNSYLQTSNILPPNAPLTHPYLFPQHIPSHVPNAPTSIKLFPPNQGLKRDVLQWVFDHALDRLTWVAKVQGTPDVIIKALGSLVQINEPTPVQYRQNSVEFQYYEQDMLTLLRFFITPINAEVVFKHQQFTSIVNQLIRTRSIVLFEFLLKQGYIIDKQVLYLFTMTPPTFNDYNDLNIYVPTYRELTIDKKWQGLEGHKIAYLGNNQISSLQQGQRLIAEAQMVVNLTNPPKGTAQYKKKQEAIGKVLKEEKKKQEELKKKKLEQPGDAVIDEQDIEDNQNEDQIDHPYEYYEGLDFTKMKPEQSDKLIAAIKRKFQSEMQDSLTELEKHDKEIAAKHTVYPIDYNNIPNRLPPHCPKYQTLHRFDLMSKQGLSQLISSGLLIDHKKEDVLGRCGIPKLQFDVLEPICIPNQEEQYAKITSRDQMERLLNDASKAELGKCCWTILQYLYQTYYTSYQRDINSPPPTPTGTTSTTKSIPFSDQSSFLNLFFMFIQYCPDIEYAMYMLMTPIDSVGFVSTSFNWLFYKILLESFPTARIPFSLFGKLYLLSGNPQRVTNSMITQLYSAMITEDILRHAIHAFNHYTISSRQSLEEENAIIHKRIVEAHHVTVRKQMKQQAQQGQQQQDVPEPPTLYELGLQEFKYQLDYHDTEVHSFQGDQTAIQQAKALRTQSIHLLNTSPLKVIHDYTPPRSKPAYVNQKYFNMLSFDSQFQHLSDSTPTSQPAPTKGVLTKPGIYVSHIAQRAVTALACDLLFQYKLDPELSKDVLQHRDIRESHKAATNHDEFITSLTIFRRLFQYTRFIPLQLVFFFTHLVPTGDISLYLDLYELQAFYTQMGRDGLFNQEAMFLAQPVQYHVFPPSQAYNNGIKNNLALLYEFNAEYALNKPQDNTKLMSGEDPKKEKGAPNSSTPIEITPQPELSPYNMANYYTMYYDDVNSTTSPTIYKFDMLPQRNNAINPYIAVDLSGTFLINDVSEEEQALKQQQLQQKKANGEGSDNDDDNNLYRSSLPAAKDLNELAKLWITMCEQRRVSLFGQNPPNPIVPQSYMLRIELLDKNSDHSDDEIGDSSNNNNQIGSKSAPSNTEGLTQQINLQQDSASGEDQSMAAQGSSSGLLGIGVMVASLLTVAAAAAYYLAPNSPATSHAPTHTAPQTKKPRKRPQNQDKH